MKTIDEILAISVLAAMTFLPFPFDVHSLKDHVEFVVLTWTEKTTTFENGEKLQSEVIVSHCNIIEQSFWRTHPSILDEEPPII
ncbi:hypothetical protein Pint_26993 [Pistacia integerrima]|uniref:Uncharacterized protein n=2 Tax=Pistacia TaxID=55512 RepID=A0ACC1BF61_9ROSI|nr:hypothetical protein Pint_26993 [Pistacia integerrima]KAJ0097478.1 hypothetical protein Patl1_27631 [Pistacia atlantica]